MNNVETATPLRKQAEESLRKAILSGRYDAGERLKERQLMESLGVSRTLLREALRQIEAEGLVTLVPNRGPIVSVLSYEDAEEIYEVRGTLESQACIGFVLRASSNHVRQLQAVFVQLKPAAEAGDVHRTLEFSSDFYDVILEGSGNKILSSMLKLLHNRIVLLRRTSMSEAGRLPETLDELTQMFNALCAATNSAASKASIHHVRQASRAALRVMRKRASDPRGFNGGSIVDHDFLAALVMTAAWRHAQPAYPTKPITLGCRLRAGRRHRHRRAHHRQGARGRAGPAGRGRQPRRRRRRHRRHLGGPRAPDGYTLLLGTGSELVVLPAVRAKPPYDALKEFAPIAEIGTVTLMLVAYPVGAGEHGPGADRAGTRQPRSAHLCLVRHGLDQPSHWRVLHREDRHQPAARALQGQRRGGDGSRLRPGQARVRDD